MDNLKNSEVVFKSMKRIVEDCFNMATGSGTRRILISLMSEMAFPGVEDFDVKVKRTFKFLESQIELYAGHRFTKERSTLKDILATFKELVDEKKEAV